MMSNFVINRFTTRYAPKIDRMVIMAEGPQGEGMIVRVHPDLMRQMVEKLCAWVEQTAAPVAAVKAKAVTSQQRQAYNDMAQSEARVQKAEQPVEPVRPQLFSKHTEPTALTMTIKGNTLVVYFKDNDLTTVLQIQKRAVRQWLDILYRHWQSSQWSQEVWPGWIVQAEKSVAH